MNQIDPEPIRRSQTAIAADPDVGLFQFGLESEWHGEYRTSSVTGALDAGGRLDAERYGRFRLEVDEPTQIDGTDTAPNPVEYLLQALAGCFSVTLATNAALRGIVLDRVALALTADLNLAGFLGADRRPGIDAINMAVFIEAPGTSHRELQELVEVARKRSVIWDTLAGNTSVSVRLNETGA